MPAIQLVGDAVATACGVYRRSSDDCTIAVVNSFFAKWKCSAFYEMQCNDCNAIACNGQSSCGHWADWKAS